MSDFNPILILISVVCTVMVFLINVYILVHFQHPEDHNQAWIPKMIVVLGLSLAELSVLMLPLDVGNRAACDAYEVAGACDLTLPMRELWFAVYMLMFILVVAVIPLALFYYEADSDSHFCGRLWSASQWVLGTNFIVALTLGIAYGLVGYVDYPVETLASGVVPLDFDLDTAHACIAPGHLKQLSGTECDGTEGDVESEDWAVRTSFPVYCIAVASMVGWLLFMIFAGVGVIGLPLDLILSYAYRPTKVITKSEYNKQASELFARGKELQEEALQLRLQEKGGVSGFFEGRKFRKAVVKVGKSLAQLEFDERALQEVYPQGEDADSSWAFTVMGYYLRLALGCVGAVVSLCWLLHIILYMFVRPPASPFLNDFFVALDSAFGLFGTAAFALFCFYIIMCVVKGNMLLGLSLGFVTVHPMKVGGTMMSSFLFNVALICMCSVSVIQFCAQAFDVYANETSVQEIFGIEILHLRGLKYLFVHNVFLYCFFVFAMLTLIALLVRGAKKRQSGERFDVAFT